MPKLKRLTTYTGSILSPLFQHMKQVNFKVSPYDPSGNKIASVLITNFKYGDIRLKPQEYKVNVETAANSKNTYMEVTYSNMNRERLEVQVRAYWTTI